MKNLICFKSMIFSVISLFSCTAALCQVSLECWRTFDYAMYNDYAYKGFIHPSGDIIVMGVTSAKYSIIGFDQDGNITNYFCSDFFYNESPGGFAMSDSGTVYITGNHYAAWPTYNNAYTIKFNPATNDFNWYVGFGETSTG